MEPLSIVVQPGARRRVPRWEKMRCSSSCRGAFSMFCFERHSTDVRMAGSLGLAATIRDCCDDSSRTATKTQ
jgi:hypothetical protein